MSTFLLQRSPSYTQTNFDRSWVDYQDGFGEQKEGVEFWLGLENLHLLTTSTCYQAQFTVEIFETAPIVAVYKPFRVGNESTNYKLELYIDWGSDGLTDVLAFDNNGMEFTTFDNDNDMKTTDNCAVMTSGGWWYNNCSDGLPTAVFAPNGISEWPYVKWDAGCTLCNITSLFAVLQRC